MSLRVAVFGGGVAGLTVAHELAAAGGDAFEITVYERNPDVGGKARSFPKPGSAPPGGLPLPGEHGFRFFPGYYRHVIDTMQRIPFLAGGPTATVAGNLVAAPETHMARTSGPVVRMPNQFPESITELAQVFSFPGQVDIPVTESMRFTTKLLQMLCACDDRRLGEYERMSWFDYVEGDECGDDYRKYLADGLNQRTVAASGRDVSARSVGLTMIRIVRDWLSPGTCIDRVLDGPTSDRWIQPWRDELVRLGVRFQLDTTLTALDWSLLSPIGGATVATADGPAVVDADAYVVALPLDDARVVAQASGLIGAGVGLDGLPELGADWMNGIQFYLDGVLDLAAGHTIYVDSEFSLTSISQRQFWDDIAVEAMGDGTVKSILSVDISDWDTPCRCHGVRAKDMTREQLKDEVWRQLVAHIEPAYGTSPPDVVDWFLDPAIEERTDPDARPRTTNREALFINRTGSWFDRPEAVTGVPNLYLASDYVRTITDLATMEAANEAGRRAARGVLESVGVDPAVVDQVRLFDFPEPPGFSKLRQMDQEIWTYVCGPRFDAADLPACPPPRIPDTWDNSG